MKQGTVQHNNRFMLQQLPIFKLAFIHANEWF